jgi:hypothetical protein
MKILKTQFRMNDLYYTLIYINDKVARAASDVN